MADNALQIVENAVVVGAFTVTPVGLKILGQPTEAEWLRVGEMLRVMERALQFAIGDWMIAGDAYFAQMAAQAIDAEHFSEETVRSFKWVAEKVPMENRRADLAWSHHQVVAALPVSQQPKWLERAATGDGEGPWSVHRLRHEVAASEEPDGHVGYMLTIEFDQPSNRDIVAREHERIGRPVRCFEKTVRKTRDDL